MNVAVVGGGSLGLLFAAKLSENRSVNVWLLTRTERQAKRIEQHGVHLRDGLSEQADLVQVPVQAACIRSVEKASWDFILLMVKQVHIDEDLTECLARMVGSNTRVLCFQNGIGHREKLSTSIRKDQLYEAITTEAALKTDDHYVTHTGKGMTTIGQIGNMGLLEADRFCFLTEAGFDIELSKKIETVIWNKLLVNSVINPLTAILRVRNGQLILNEDWIIIMRKLLDEGIAVARLQQYVHIEESIWDRLMNICRATAANESSMLQDIARGRRTEIDAINGVIVRLANVHRIAVPVQQTVYRLIKGIEAGDT